MKYLQISQNNKTIHAKFTTFTNRINNTCTCSLFTCETKMRAKIPNFTNSRFDSCWLIEAPLVAGAATIAPVLSKQTFTQLSERVNVLFCNLICDWR